MKIKIPMLGVSMLKMEKASSERGSEAREEHRTYVGRYYVLAVLSLLCALQNVGWFTFSPIAAEAKESYGLTDLELLLLPGE